MSLLRLSRRLGLLLQRPLNCPSHTVLQTDKGPITQPPLRLLDIEVPCHSRVQNPHPSERGTHPDQPAHRLSAPAQDEPHFSRNRPHVLLPTRAPGRIPNQSRKVPKVNGAVVGDKEGLAVDLFVV